MQDKRRESFGSKIGVIAAAAGSAIGLGNIYRFPCELGNNGGAAFLLVYVAIVLLLGIPIMLCELVIGRRSQSDVVGSFKKLVPKSAWPIVGYLGVLSGLLILAYYSTVAGWTLEYIFKAVTNDFYGKDSAAIEQGFADFQNNGWLNVLWQGVFLFLTAFVVFRGVQKGIEKFSKVLMPLLLLILVILGVRSVTLPDSFDGLTFLFKPDFSKIDGNVLLSALGQGFLSLSVGMGALITYGSYIKKDDNLATTALSVAFFDTFVAVLAGIVIFPASFSFGVKPTAGMGLVFNTLPMIFNKMSCGYVFCIIFFVLLAIAALTSTISLLEVLVAYVSEELHVSRHKATVLATTVTFVIGIFASLSLAEGSPFRIANASVLDSLDRLTAKVLLPLGALMIVVFVGWKLGKSVFYDEMTNGGVLKSHLVKIFFFIIRFVAPLAIMVIFVSGLMG